MPKFVLKLLAHEIYKYKIISIYGWAKENLSCKAYKTISSEHKDHLIDCDICIIFSFEWKR